MLAHQSVFLTPLEFLAAWDWLQSEVSQSELSTIVTKAIRIYRLNQAVINRLDLPAPDGKRTTSVWWLLDVLFSQRMGAVWCIRPVAL